MPATVTLLLTIFLAGVVFGAVGSIAVGHHRMQGLARRGRSALDDRTDHLTRKNLWGN